MRMMLFLRIVILGCIAINVLTTEFQIDCDATGKTVFVEGVDQLSCSCYGTDGIASTYDWTFVHDAGHWERLARCHGGGNCTTSYSPSDLEVSANPIYSFLVFHNLTTRFSGVVTCQETSSTSSYSASYRMTVKHVSITDCNGGISIPEDSLSSGVACDHSPYTPSTVTWTIKMLSGQLLHLGSCRSIDNYNCTSMPSSNVALTAGSDYCNINFQNSFIKRDMAAVICSITFSDSPEADSCAMDIYHPASVENCSLETSRYNWSLIMSCDVTNMFTSEGRYESRIYERFTLLKNGQLVEMDDFAYEGVRSFLHYLQAYVNSTDNKQYYRGRVSVSWPLSPYAGYYMSVLFETYHDGSSEVNFQPDGLVISLPARPTHNCSDVTTPCFCSTETLGSPAGRLLWLIGNTTVAIGDYGVKQLLLPSDNLTNGQEVMIATCPLDWIQPLIAQEPAILCSTYDSQFTSLAIAGWTRFGITVVISVVFLFILIRPRFIARCKDQNDNAAVLEEEER